MSLIKSSISVGKNLFWQMGANAGFLVVVLVAFALGYMLNERGPAGGTSPGYIAGPEAGEGADSVEDTRWTCAMHPEIQLREPGQCPICGMDLIPVKSGGDSSGVPRLVTTEAAAQLMRIQTSTVERRFAPVNIRMVGKIDYDETRIGYITAWVPGRLDRLYVDYTGVQVNKGDHMVYLYSPELLAGQDELLRAAEAVKRLRPDSPTVLKESARASLAAVREKLRRWGLTEEQISDAEQTGSSSDHITVYAPMGGTVIQKNGQEGMYVQEGTNIYTIADLSRVWLRLDAYESDLPWLHLGQSVTFSTEAYPGEMFNGKIAFIDPVLDARTRTIKVRVNVPNEDGRLKPEMFARAEVWAQIATRGRVMAPGLAGKWISPMHPEIVKDGPGECDICGMALVKAEDLGYVSALATDADMPLIIPVTAALVTGRRAVVYVVVPGQDSPTYEGREIVLGPRAGDYYIVKSGLYEGEEVVTNGNFKIDSALQIMARPSMMAPGGGARAFAAADRDGKKLDNTVYDASPEFRAQLREVFNAYTAVSEALVEDSLDEAHEAGAAVLNALEAMVASLPEPDAEGNWQRLSTLMTISAQTVVGATDLAAGRIAFEKLSEALSESVQSFGLSSGTPVIIVNCPMAFGDRGGDWLQSSRNVRNPYLGVGSGMPDCGSIRSVLVDEHGHAPH